jgi:hypothetical protein
MERYEGLLEFVFFCGLFSVLMSAVHAMLLHA